MAALTSGGEESLTVDLWDWEGNRRTANYAYFRVSSGKDSFRLHLTDFSGDAGRITNSSFQPIPIRFTLPLSFRSSQGLCASLRQRLLVNALSTCGASTAALFCKALYFHSFLIKKALLPPWIMDQLRFSIAFFYPVDVLPGERLSLETRLLAVEDEIMFDARLGLRLEIQKMICFSQYCMHRFTLIGYMMQSWFRSKHQTTNRDVPVTVSKYK
jgi:hypothetical protein